MACGNPIPIYKEKSPKIANAGHFHSVGTDPAIRFHAFNIWVCCIGCNLYRYGNIAGYSATLKDKLPPDTYNYILDLPTIYKGLKLMPYEKEHALKVAGRFVKELLAEGKHSRTIAERIELRKKINKELNLYP
jgi:hypothetical protein